MTAKRTGSRIVTGCLATMLLPAGLALAQTRSGPEPEPRAAAEDRRTASRIAPAEDRRVSILGARLSSEGAPGRGPDCGSLLDVFPVASLAIPGAGPLALSPNDAGGSWFRTTPVPLRPEGPCPVGSTDAVAPGADPVEAQPDVPGLLPPGTVQDLRRVERR